MANYFIKGAATVPSGAPRSRDDVVHVSDMYRLYIQNKSNTVKFSGYVPEDFNFSLSSPWSSPFAGMSLAEAGGNSNALSKTIKFAGASSIHKLASARVWDSPQYLTLELPIFLDAYHSAEEEVVEPMVQLLCMAAPSEVGGILIPPGPIPAYEVIDAVMGGLQQYTGRENKEFESGEAFTVKLGSFFSMSPAVITNVSGSGDCAFEDVNGKPISADFMISVESYFAVTRSDLYEWFGLPVPSETDAAVGRWTQGENARDIVKRAAGVLSW